MTITTAQGVTARLQQWVEARPWLDARKLSPRQLQQASRELHVGLTELLRAREELMSQQAAQLEQASRAFQTMQQAATQRAPDLGGKAFDQSPAMARFHGSARQSGSMSLQEAHSALKVDDSSRRG